MIRLRPGRVFFVQCEGGTPNEEMPGVIQARKLRSQGHGTCNQRLKLLEFRGVLQKAET